VLKVSWTMSSDPEGLLWIWQTCLIRSQISSRIKSRVSSRQFSPYLRTTTTMSSQTRYTVSGTLSRIFMRPGSIVLANLSRMVLSSCCTVSSSLASVMLSALQSLASCICSRCVVSELLQF
jgi:hypothetical protein